jgi:putative ATP-binding cassette transporter
VQPTRHPGHFDLRFVRHLAGLTRIYWTSADAKRGGPLLMLCIAMELGLVYANVELASANADVFNAVQGKAWPRFVDAIEHFLLMALVVVLISTYRIYFRNILQIRWREHLTAYFIDGWIGPYAYGHSQLHHKETDNPDQRISEDIQSYVASALGLSLSLLSAVATLVSFSGVLWRLSGTWPLRVGGQEYWIPGLMMWVAILYSIVSMFLTHQVGRTLVGINFDRLRFEADFRYGLVRFRDHTEGVALARGEGIERHIAMERFRAVITNWWDLITKQRNLTLLTGGIGQANGIVPLLVAAPAFFAGRMALGGVTETGIAYGQVSGALSWFVDAYQEIAAWRASIERLSTFRETLEETRADVERPDAVRVVEDGVAAIRLVDLELDQPGGEVLAKGLDADLPKGDRTSVLGPAGAVKTTLFRAIAGIWPFGHGRIEMPRDERALFLPRQPYLPMGSLRDAVSYPAETGAFSDDAIREVLTLLELEPLATRLDDSESWEQHLSGDEQQRLVFARALLHAPDWLIMDDATAALDEATERRVYEIVAARLPGTTVVSLTNRPNVAQMHRRRFTLEVGDGSAASLRPA